MPKKDWTGLAANRTEEHQEPSTFLQKEFAKDDSYYSDIQSY